MSDANMTAEGSWLLDRLAGLTIETDELTEHEARSLYLAAAARAGIAPVQSLQLAPAVGGKKKTIRWQKWALTAAAALLVCTAGVLGLVSGGFGMKTADNAAPEMAAMDMAETEAYSLYGTASSTASAEVPSAAPEAAPEEKDTAYYATGGTAKKDAGTEVDGAANFVRNELTTETETGTDSTAAQHSLTADWPAALMVEGVIYLYDEGVYPGEVPESAIIGFIDSYTDTWPAADWQTNFSRITGLAVARVDGQLLLRYEGAWHPCTPEGGAKK